MTENEVLRSILQHTEAMVYVIDIHSFEVLYANTQCINEFGNIEGKICYEVLQANQLAPCSFCPLSHVKNRTTLRDGISFHWENFNTKNQKYYLYNDYILRWDENQRLAKVQVGLDITEKKHLEKQLQDEQNRTLLTLKTVLNATLEGILLFDDNNRCTFANHTARKLFGYSKREFMGKPIFSFFQNPLPNLKSIKSAKFLSIPNEQNMRRKDNSFFPALLREQMIMLKQDGVRMLSILDTSALKKKEEELLFLAYHDPLTSLPNRLYLANEMTKCLHNLSRHNSFHALLFLDLDHFKTINDTKGHDIGDKVLIEIAYRLKQTLRSSDIISRIGGDEFAILINTNEITKKKALNIIYSLTYHLLEVVKTPIHINNIPYRMTLSIGVALFNTTLYSFDEIMKFADTAMYQAKENGRNQIMFFDPAIHKTLELKVDILNNLRKALVDKRLQLFYQPQISTHSSHNTIIGVEALIRWFDLKTGIILPQEFIYIAEENGCIIHLGEWVLQEAFKQIKQWEYDTEKKEWRMSINISIKQLEHENFLPMVKSLLSEIAPNPHKIRFEFTENILIKNTRTNIHKMRELKKLGISLSIDDLGIGYSSLAYLKKLPIQELKIDRSFIKHLLTNPIDTIIVQMILDIAKYFKIDAVAEGVETIEQYKKLKAMGCNLFQGFLFFKPISIKQLSSLSLPNIEESIK